jgi:hypothetical protein
VTAVLIVGPESEAKSKLAQRLSARLRRHKYPEDRRRHQPRELNVVTARLVDQQDGVLIIDPHQPLFRRSKPLLVVLVRHMPTEQTSDWIATDLAEEAGALTLCASASMPLRILTAEEAIEPAVMEQIAEVVETLSGVCHASAPALDQACGEVST